MPLVFLLKKQKNNPTPADYQTNIINANAPLELLTVTFNR